MAMESSTIVNNMTSVMSEKETAPIFLQTRAAQGIAGVFVWLALFLTCQQVFHDEFFKHLYLSRHNYKTSCGFQFFFYRFINI